MKKLTEELIKHIQQCPLSWADDKIIRHKDTTDKEILNWLQKLIGLNALVKEDELDILDLGGALSTRNRIRTL